MLCVSTMCVFCVVVKYEPTSSATSIWNPQREIILLPTLFRGARIRNSKKCSLFDVLRVVEHFPTLAAIKRERKCYVLKLLQTVFSKDKSTFGSKTGNDNFRLDGIKKHEKSEAH